MLRLPPCAPVGNRNEPLAASTSTADRSDREDFLIRLRHREGQPVIEGMTALAITVEAVTIMIHDRVK
jgi:hypothetical protein